MNHCFRSIWNSATGTFVAAPETAKASSAATRSVRDGSLRSAFRVTPLALALGLSYGAHAATVPPTQLPTGGVVKAGSATIGTSTNTLTINQSSSRAVIDWKSFNVGSAATVNFVQPDTSAVTLNRVVGNEGSVIDGALKANGQVFLINPNGVLFGKGATVDTGGLLASTLDISNADFMAGKSTFATGGKRGSVVNEGSLSSSGGGYIALIGQQVSNDGVITARLGTVAMAAGDKVTLNFNGTLLVDVTIDKAVYDGLVENKQIIVADGGLVKLTAGTADSLLNTVVNNTGLIQSETIANQSGRIFLLGEGGRVEVAGTLDASAPSSGDGGHIETSGSKVRVADGTHITTSAANGTTGTWLVDPTDFTVAASGGDITGATLTSELANTNVQLQSSSGSASGNGDININDAVSWASHTLTLTAANNVNINAVMNASGTASLDLEPAAANGADSAVAGGTVNVGMDAIGNFTGKVNFSGSGSLTIGGQLYTVINSLGSSSTDTTAGTLQGMQGNLGGHYALGSDIDATATAGWNSGAGFAPVGVSNYFTGTFDGLGHTINGLTLNSPSYQGSGLFGKSQGTSSSPVFVRNIALTSLDQLCGGGEYCAGLVGDAEGYTSFRNVSVSGTISGQELESSGFIAGYLDSYNFSGPVFDDQIIHAFASGTITANEPENVGGMVGEMYGVLSDVHVNVNMTFSLGYYSGGDNIGGVAGKTIYGSINKATALGTITMEGTQQGQSGSAEYEEVGGLVGQNGVTISNSHSSMALVSRCSFATCTSGEYEVGGLVGSNEADFVNSYFDGSLTLNRPYNEYVGGLAGSTAYGSIINSYSSGAISLPAANNENVGGISGDAYNTIINKTYSTGNITVGDNARYVGGVIGYSNSGGNTWTNAYATGSVTVGASSTAIGGFSGYADTTDITNAYASGAVTAGVGSTSVGGFVGEAGGSVNLTNVYANGAVSGGLGSTQVGGLAGVDDGGNTVVASFWDTTATGKSTSAFGVGMTTAQMRQSANFNSATAANGNANPGWDLANDWIVYDGQTAPLLRSFMTAVTVSVSGTKVYDGTVGGGLAAYSIAVDPSLVNGALVATGAGRNVGSYNVTLSGLYSSQQGYAFNFVGGTTTVTPATLTVTAAGGSQVYNAGTVANVTLVSNGVSGDQLTLTDTAATLANKNVGTNKSVSVTGISISGADAGNYVLANTSTTTTTNVTPAMLTATATGGTQVYNGTAVTNVTLGAVPISGDQVTLSDTAATLADKNVGNGKAVSVTGISLSGTDAGNYVLASSSASTTTNVTPATLTVSATGVSQVYNGTTVANVTLGSNAVSGDQLTLSDSAATLADKNVGSGKAVGVTGIAVSGADAGNYVLANTSTSTTTNVTPAALVVSATGGTQVYNGTTVANVILGSNAMSGDLVSLSDAAATLASKNAGTGKAVSVTGIAVTGADAGNYVLASNSATTTTNVTPATLTVSATGGTQVYNGTTTANVSLGSNAVAGDQLSLSDAAATLADKNVGTGKAVNVTGISVSGADAGNYVLANSSTSTTTNVTPATLVVSATGGSQVYNGTTVANVTLGSNAVSGDQLSLSDAAATLVDKNVGSGKAVGVTGIAVSGADAGNYVLSNTSASTTTNITPATLNVSATGGAQVYNGTTAASVSLASNAISGDQVSLSDAAATMADKNVGTGKAVSVSGISVSGADAGNYVLANASATTTTNVTHASLTVSATGGSQVYNATTTANVSLSSTAVAGDQLSLSDGAATLADKNVGTGKAVAVTGIAVSGADAGNYTLSNTTASTTTNVTPATITVAATGGMQVYNGTTAANVSLVANGIAGDQVSLTDASATMADKNVGAGKAVTVTGIGLSGADAGNYTLASTTAATTTTVTPASLTVIASAPTQALTNGTNVIASLSGNIVSGDDVSLTDTGATVTDKSIGAGKQVTVVGIAATGADASNYTLANTTATTTANVVSSASAAVAAVTGSADQSVTTTQATVSGLAPASTQVIPLAMPAQANLGTGQPMLVYATPGNSGDGSVTLDELRKMMQVGPGEKVVVPVANSKFVSLLNGGVKLPNGVEQQFFVNSAKH